MVDDDDFFNQYESRKNSGINFHKYSIFIVVLLNNYYCYS